MIRTALLVTHIGRKTLLPFCVLLFACLVVGCKKNPQTAAKQAGEKGARWLKTQQVDDGTFAKRPDIKVGLTALAAIAMMDQGLDEKDPDVRRAVTFLHDQRKEDGSIRIQEALENYETALSIVALGKTGNSAYNEAVKKGQAYLKGLQQGAKGEIKPDNPKFGGIGYGRRQHPDLSNTQFGLEALRETDLSLDDEAFKNAISFVQNCQNLQKANNQPWATNDGGFVYFPGMSQANGEEKTTGPLTSYGSMTAAGVLAFSYCNVPKDDPRVQAALGWLREHYTLDENPGMGQEGRYYYYMILSKALASIGEKYFVDSKGKKHNWALEITNKLIELQHPDGYWMNDKSDRWMEDNKALVTAYCMIALNRCRPFLEAK